MVRIREGMSEVWKRSDGVGMGLGGEVKCV